MKFNIDEKHPLQLYKQLANEIIMKIATGELKQGDTLPSVRSLAKELQINVNTVSKSYHVLADKGIIELRPKSLAKIKRKKTEDEAAKVFEDELTLLVAEAYANGISRTSFEKIYKKVLRKNRK